MLCRATGPTVERCGGGVRVPDAGAGRGSHERHTWGFSSAEKSMSFCRRGIPACGVSRQGVLRSHQQFPGSAENLFLKVYSAGVRPTFRLLRTFSDGGPKGFVRRAVMPRGHV